MANLAPNFMSVAFGVTFGSANAIWWAVAEKVAPAREDFCRIAE